MTINQEEVADKQRERPPAHAATAVDFETLSSGAARLWAVRLFGDLAALVGAAGLASLLRFRFDVLEVSELKGATWGSHLLAACVWTVTFLLIAAANRLYDEDTLFPGGGEVGRLVHTGAESVAVLSVFVFFTHTFVISRSWLGLLAVFSLAFLVGQRMLFRRELSRRRSNGRLRRSAVLVTRASNGTSTPPEPWAEVPEFEIVTTVDYETMMEKFAVPEATSTRVRGINRPLLILRSWEFNEIELWDFVVNAGDLGYDAMLASHVRAVGRDRLTLREFGGHTVVKITPPRFEGWRAVQKRVFDISLSIACLVLLIPLFLVVGLLVLVTSGWPVFFGQDRMGKDGRIFRMWKFRTMRRDAEAGVGHVWAAKDDPRRTPVGRVLRRYSIDELPQLWNVLKGSMSIVGPRPEMSTIAAQFNSDLPSYRYRHRIRPGITGLAQAKGFRGNTSLQTRIELDNWYIENWSIALDLKIIGLSFREVLFSKVVY